MHAIIQGDSLNGVISVPPSKSYMQRVCAMALLHNGKTIIQNPGSSNDDLAVLKIIQELGAVVERKDDSIHILSKGETNFSGTIIAEESGLAARMFAPILAMSSTEVILTGSGSLMHRPVELISNVLPFLGVQVADSEGYLPIKLKGPLKPRNIEVDGTQSSQYLTGLLIAISFSTKEDINLRVTDLVSKHYIDLTLDLLKTFGCIVTHEDYEIFKISPRTTVEQELIVRIEGDWSAAAPILVGAALSGSVKVKGLNHNSLQADKVIVDVLRRAGVHINVQDDVIEVDDTGELFSFEHNAVHTPDLFPPLAVLALFANGTSHISGVQRLFNKESNRAATIADMIREMGGQMEVRENNMFIKGGCTLKSAVINPERDHRIVMAATIAAIGAGVKVEIKDADAVEKSYPNFFKALQSLGVNVTLT